MAVRRSILVVLPHRRYFYDLPASGTVTMGRAPECQLRIDDSVVSRRHALLHVHPVLRLEDLGSENGTLVEISTGSGGHGTVTTELLRGDSLELAARAVIRLGDSRLIVQDASVAPFAGEDLSRCSSAPMQAVLETAALAARSRIPVLIQGETGVGKEVLAERIHELSGRSPGCFFRLSCAGPIESQLQVPDQGTLFLDEIGELPLLLQTRLVSLLESVPADVRTIAATHRNLEDDVASGRFRADLFFRLYGIRIAIPPLRERVEEVVPLARFFLAREARSERLPEPIFSADALALLCAYPWPGNMRELRHVVQRALLLCRTGVIEPAHLPDPVRSGRSVIRAPAAPTAQDRPADEERDRLLQALEASGGNQAQTARLLGISRMTLSRRIQKYGVHRTVTLR